MQASTIRISGAAVFACALTWAACYLAGPPATGVNTRIEIAGSLVFQLGLFAMLLAMRGTDATGTGRWGRAVLAVQAVLLALATAWTIPHVVSPNMTDHGIMVALDAAWPLSMAWLIPLGVTVARARRWPSPARFAPLMASLWLVADLAAMAAGHAAFTIIHIAWLIGAYGWLGLVLIRDVADTAGQRLPAVPEPTTAT